MSPLPFDDHGTPFEYHGTAAVRRFFTTIDGHRRDVAHLAPTGANGQPAWGEYVRDPTTGRLCVSGVIVVGLARGRIREVAHFEGALAPSLGLPRTLD